MNWQIAIGKVAVLSDPFCNYYSPRRIPYRDSGDSGDQGPKRRDFILFFVGLFVLVLIVFFASIVSELQGLSQMAMGLRVFSGILLFVTLGTGFMVALSYFVTSSFLKREFSKKFKKIDEEQQAQLRRMMGANESDDEQD
ncbi:MAG: hypothetical protein ACFFDP_09045 [Promethearchaeota archaeon]